MGRHDERQPARGISSDANSRAALNQNQGEHRQHFQRHRAALFSGGAGLLCIKSWSGSVDALRRA